MPAYVCAACTSGWCPRKPEEGNRSPGAGVTDEISRTENQYPKRLQVFECGVYVASFLILPLPPWVVHLHTMYACCIKMQASYLYKNREHHLTICTLLERKGRKKTKGGKGKKGGRKEREKGGFLRWILGCRSVCIPLRIFISFVPGT